MFLHLNKHLDIAILGKLFIEQDSIEYALNAIKSHSYTQFETLTTPEAQNVNIYCKFLYKASTLNVLHVLKNDDLEYL